MANNTSYNIILGEYQRQLIQRGLEQLRFANTADIEIPSYHDDVTEALLMLRDMVAELPENEAKHPGTLHGFVM